MRARSIYYRGTHWAVVQCSRHNNVNTFLECALSKVPMSIYSVYCVTLRMTLLNCEIKAPRSW